MISQKFIEGHLTSRINACDDLLCKECGKIPYFIIVTQVLVSLSVVFQQNKVRCAFIFSIDYQVTES